jgi:hypothetical protein
VLNRYYLNNPWVEGLGSFLAGFGQQRQAVKAAEAQRQMQQNQAWGQAIGSGLQTAGSLGAMGIVANDLDQLSMPGGMGPPSISNFERMQLLGSFMPGMKGFAGAAGDVAGRQSQTALHQMIGDRQIQLENLRTSNDRLQTADKAMLMAEYGLDPAGNAVQPSMPPPAELPGGMTSGITGQPEQGYAPDSGPSQPPRPIDPANTAPFRRADRAIGAIHDHLDELIRTGAPPQQVYAAKAAAAPELARLVQERKSYQQPPPPTTAQEMAAAGVHGGGYTEMPDGSIILPKGMTRSLPSKTSAGQSVTGDKTPAYTTHDGVSQPLHWGINIAPDGTRVTVDSNGNVTDESKGAAAKPIDYGKEYEMSRKALATEGGANPEPESIKADVEKRRQAIEEMKHDEQAKPLMQQAAKLLRDAYDGKLDRQEADRWAAGIIAVYGRNMETWPAAVRNQFEHLRSEIGD